VEHQILLEKITRVSRMVDDFLLQFIRQDRQIPNLHEGLLYALGLDSDEQEMRGKRLRPALGMLVCEALGGRAEDILTIAVAVELFHNFTLIHDDIEDGDTFRRNRPCVHVKYGLAHGINIGDYTFVKAFRAMMEQSPHPIPPRTKDKIFEVLTNAFEHTHIGQALDINARSRHDITTDEYFLIVSEKTGYCLAAPMIAAAILNRAGKSVRRAFESYANAIGPMFQIRDDMLDLTEGKGRKSIGSDIREGKRSFLVAHVGSVCTREEREKLYLILDAPREKTTDNDIQWVIQLFQKYGSFEAAEETNKNLLSKALRAIARVPQNPKELLISFAELLLTRKR